MRTTTSKRTGVIVTQGEHAPGSSRHLVSGYDVGSNFRTNFDSIETTPQQDPLRMMVLFEMRCLHDFVPVVVLVLRPSSSSSNRELSRGTRDEDEDEDDNEQKNGRDSDSRGTCVRFFPTPGFGIRRWVEFQD